MVMGDHGVVRRDEGAWWHGRLLLPHAGHARACPGSAVPGLLPDSWGVMQGWKDPLCLGAKRGCLSICCPSFSAEVYGLTMIRK